MKPAGKRFVAPILTNLLPLFLLFSYTSAATAQTAGTFIPTGNMTAPRINHTATLLLNGKVLITGGWVPGGPQLASAELFDPDTGRFTTTGDMTTRRSDHTATLLPDGRVLIAGGNALNLGTEEDPRYSAELYDPSSRTFTATGTTAHRWHTATLLDKGKVLITSDTNENELFDPTTGVFTATGEYAVTGPQNPYGPGEWGMVFAPATSLPNGKVLIAGEPSAELYDPVAGTFSLAGTMATRPWGQQGEHLA